MGRERTRPVSVLPGCLLFPFGRPVFFALPEHVAQRDAVDSLAISHRSCDNRNDASPRKRHLGSWWDQRAAQAVEVGSRRRRCWSTDQPGLTARHGVLSGLFPMVGVPIKDHPDGIHVLVHDGPWRGPDAFGYHVDGGSRDGELGLCRAGCKHRRFTVRRRGIP
jgi:hypothetical protein